MARKKNKPVNTSTTRVRVAPKKRSASNTRTGKNGTRAERSVKQAPTRAFDAMKWCGILPELAGDTLTIQRRMRDEW